VIKCADDKIDKLQLYKSADILYLILTKDKGVCHGKEKEAYK